jgi:Rrf2 family protein
MRLSAKTDYALRACAELGSITNGRALTVEQVAERQMIPLRFLKTILPELAARGITKSSRGHGGGWKLAKPADGISIADVIRAIDGPLASVAGTTPHHLAYQGSSAAYKDLWVAVRWNLRRALETVTIADIAAGDLPSHIEAATRDPDAWVAR